MCVYFQIWNKQDRQAILTALSKLFLNLKCVADIGCYFRPFVLDIAERTKNLVLREGHANTRLLCKLAVGLGLALPVCPELERCVFCVKIVATESAKDLSVT